MTRKQYLLRCIKDLMKYGPYDRSMGICGNLSMSLKLSEKHLLFDTWRHTTGDTSYPIPSNNKKIDDPHTYYYSLKDKWRGKQREYRTDLLRHMVKVIRSRDSWEDC